MSLVQSLVRGNLDTDNYPVTPSIVQSCSNWDRPREIFVVILGGATYEEARHLREFNESNPGVAIVTIGTQILNSQDTLDIIKQDVLKQEN